MKRRAPARPQRSSPGSIARTALICLLAVAALLAAGEAAVRRFAVQTTGTTFRPHPVLFWELTPNLRNFTHEAPHFKEIVSTDSRGFRGEEIPATKGPGELRVLCLGDSSTFGHGVNDGETYPARLAGLLQRAEPRRRVTVVNGGVQGYTSFQGLRLLEEKGLELRPDIITVAFINNDVSLDMMPDARRAGAGAARAVKRLLFRSHLYILLRNMAVKSQVESLPGARCTSPRVSVEEFRQNLEQFARLAKEHGFSLVFINMPRDRATGLHSDYRGALREVAAARGIPVVDCFSSWKDSLYLDLVHPNPEGQKVIAGELFKAIKERKMIRQ